MRFGVFYEHQLPGPWSQGSQQRLFRDALAQVELADRLGIESLPEANRRRVQTFRRMRETMEGR